MRVTVTRNPGKRVVTYIGGRIGWTYERHQGQRTVWWRITVKKRPPRIQTTGRCRHG